MMGRGTATASPYYLRGMIQDWNPPEKPHCTNCLHAKVGGTSDEPTVTCAQGHGRHLTLVQMIRPKAPRQFVPAVRCADFSDMGGPCNTGQR
jgi:hypothetical protein